MKSLLVLLLACSFASAVLAQGPPMFTKQYYEVKPEQYTGKDVILSVAYVTLKPKPLPDGNRVLMANTYFRGTSGGEITIHATQAAAERIIRLCGTSYQYNGGGMKESQIKGTYTKDPEAKNDPTYFVKIEK